MNMESEFQKKMDRQKKVQELISQRDKLYSLIEWIAEPMNGMNESFMAGPVDIMIQRYFVIETVILKNTRTDLTQTERAQKIHNEMKNLGFIPKKVNSVKDWDCQSLDEIYSQSFPTLDLFLMGGRIVRIHS